jgi:outer membrane protein OmpA-like peptidoglycan-associated protein
MRHDVAMNRPRLPIATTAVLGFAACLLTPVASQAASPTGPVASCQEGKGKQVTQLPKVVIPSLVVPDTTFPAETFAGGNVPAVVVPGFTVPAQIAKAGCIIRWAAPAGCLGAVEITGASIPASRLPARTIPARTLPDGEAQPALNVPAQTVPAQHVKAVYQKQVCQVTSAGHRSSVFRASLFRASLFRASMFQGSVLRGSLCAGGSCLSSQFLPSSFLPSVFQPSRFVPSVFIPAGSLAGGHGTRVLTTTKTVTYVAPGDVLFATGSATIRPQAAGALSAIAADLARKVPHGRLTVQGHTDSVGSDASNLALSLRRARAVADWLVSHGHVARSRLVEIGYGERDPEVSNDTAAHRQLNRRVVISGIRKR